MASFNVLLLIIELRLNDFDVSFEFFLEPSEATFLESNEIINVNQMITKGHLVLLFGFIKITIIHLKYGILCINFSVVVLLVNLDDLLQLLSLCKSQNFAPVSKDFHSVEMCKFLFLDHSIFEIISPDSHHLTLSVQIFERLVLHSDSYDRSPGLFSWCFALYRLA